MDLVKKGDSVTYDNLISGHEIPFMIIGVELTSGQGVLKRGSVLAKDSEGKCKLISSINEEPYGILTDDIDTDTDTISTMYRQGVFNEKRLIIDDAIGSIDLLIDDLRKINILTREII